MLPAIHVLTGPDSLRIIPNFCLALKDARSVGAKVLAIRLGEGGLGVDKKKDAEQ